MSQKYKKVSKIDVLKAYTEVESIDIVTCRAYPVSRRLIAFHLNTSLYQVNKHCKELIKDGFLVLNRVEPFHDYDYWEGIDYGNSLSILLTEVTEKGYEFIKTEVKNDK